MGGNIARQVNDMYPIAFRNLSSETMPAFGVGLITGSNVSDSGLFIPSVNDSTTNAVCGMIVNGPSAVASSGYGKGFWDVGPCLALYESSDGTPAFGEPWGPEGTTGSSAFKLRKGRMGFTIASDVTVGSGSDVKAYVMPSWMLRQPLVGYLRCSNKQLTTATSTQIVPFDAKGYNNGIWPSTTMPYGLEITTGSSAKFTVRRSGYWNIDASWSSESSPRFSAPFQSKVHRAIVAVYVNGARTQISGGLSDYYHFSLANADTTPSAGVAMRVNGAITTGTYLASGDEVDLRVTVSEVTADSGTTTEEYFNFTQCDFRISFQGAQQWRNDY